MALLRNKVAVITGAGNGIGRAVAGLFAAHEASLVLNDCGSDRSGKGYDPTVITRVSEGLRDGGGEVTTHDVDISTQAGVESLFALAMARHGRVDILVNCAGILREHALLNLRDKDLVAVLDVHIVGTFRLMQAAAVVMREQGGGRIVNTTSNNALLGNTGQVANSAAAAAIIAMTRSAAVELVRHRVFINAVAPMAKTRQTENLPLFQKIQSMTADHVSPAYLFLASDLAGDTSGEVVTIAGSKLSRLLVSESEAEYSESNDGRFDAESLAASWQRLTTQE